jgi:hypothetical protein
MVHAHERSGDQFQHMPRALMLDEAGGKVDRVDVVVVIGGAQCRSVGVVASLWPMKFYEEWTCGRPASSLGQLASHIRTRMLHVFARETGKGLASAT